MKDCTDYTRAELAKEARRLARELRHEAGVTTKTSTYSWAVRVTNRGASLVVTLVTPTATHVSSMAL